MLQSPKDCCRPLAVDIDTSVFRTLFRGNIGDKRTVKHAIRALRGSPGRRLILKRPIQRFAIVARNPGRSVQPESVPFTRAEVMGSIPAAPAIRGAGKFYAHAHH